MREVIFRAKQKDNGKWLYGVPCSFIGLKGDFCDCIMREAEGYHFLSEIYDVIPKTVGQYTGLTDKNGTKMFEGDILETHIHTSAMTTVPIHGTVTFEKGAFGIRTNRDFTAFACYCNTTFEVVGNIHDKQ